MAKEQIGANLSAALRCDLDAHLESLSCECWIGQSENISKIPNLITVVCKNIITILNKQMLIASTIS